MANQKLGAMLQNSLNQRENMHEIKIVHLTTNTNTSITLQNLKRNLFFR